jgi:hypothetical protein
MKILYISSVCSPKVLEYIFNTAIIKPGQAIQKFHRVSESSSSKGGKRDESHSDFILVRENGKLKIDGTLSDGE